MKHLPLLLIALTLACEPTTEPTADLVPEPVTFDVIAKAINHSDGIAPDTMAFLIRVVGWEPGDTLHWAVGGAVDESGVIEREQLQIAFSFNPDSMFTLSLTTWARQDSAFVTWTP